MRRHLSRRTLLLGTAAAGAVPLLPAAGLRAALAAATERRFVLLILRGGMDGLSAVPPYADPDYRTLRGMLALPEPGQEGGALDLDGFYGLHPALAAVKARYDAGEVLPIHAVATPYRERSHFDGQDLLENGTGDPRGARDGWLNRALGLLGPSGRRLGLAVGQTTPLVLRGGVEVASWAPSVLPDADPDFLALVGRLYRDDPLLSRTFAAALEAGAMADHALGPGDGMAMAPGQGQGSGQRGAQRMLAEAAGRLLADPEGPRIAVLELGGWDTHSAQGTATGRLAVSLARLDDVLEGLRGALGPAWRQSAVLVVTEFGRTAAPNGTGGTDHGTGGAALLLGGAVRGGRVLADWPGLAAGRLHQGRDLAPTADLRGVFKAVLQDHLGLPADAVARVVFPGSGEVRPAGGLLRG